MQESYVTDPVPTRFGISVDRYVELYAEKFDMTEEEVARSVLHGDEYENWSRRQNAKLGE